ncbi:hypothetical protein OCH239_09670 [Roseivivax halodurans JCM 10272]|uniref:Uncharacterized protein n=1 Tax=Roseivivax halodurans JCM 10272 TaxID=1449350 RepID=X7EC77_9RHOB|nr:hypothetical protein [Roseivivax halodurans]ETX13537.1 hypothetical protein OCH239_09670 [Roseivivax halodurans JCM 10272]
MMQHDRSILKAVTNKDYRDTLSGLLDEGWNADRTGKNHIRLTHPGAASPVIASGTPSSARSALKVRAQCRRALRQAMDAPAEPPAPKSFLEEVREGEFDLSPRRKRKKRWSPGERKSRLSVPAPSPELPREPETDREDQDAQPECEIPKPNTPQSEENIMDLAVQTDAANLRQTAPALTDIAPAATPDPAPSRGPTLGSIPGDLLGIALRILSGELQTIAVTADMVGKTLVLDGKGWMVDGAVPPTQASLADRARSTQEQARVDEPRGVRSVPLELDELSGRIRHVFEQFPDEWMDIAQLAGLVDNLAGNSARAHNQALRFRAKRMAATGILELRKTGTAKKPTTSFRIAR